MMASDCISRHYVELQQALHNGRKPYGQRGDKWAGIVLQVAIGCGARSILDYGCGEGALGAALRRLPLVGFQIDDYDPAVPGKDMPPGQADLVVVTDVLEHVEPDRLWSVLKHLRKLARQKIFAVIAMKPSNHILPDGRNAHLIVQPGSWWKQQFRHAGFTLELAPTVVRKDPKKEWAVVLVP